MASKVDGTKGPAQIAQIVACAGGKLVGRTRLQKTAYLLEATGLGSGFRFEYRHYGPYSEAVANSTMIATFFDTVKEIERPSSWGGTYSEYSTEERLNINEDDVRIQLVRLAANADPVELELVATATFLAREHHADPWGETARRKPDKIGNNRLMRAQGLYRKFLELPTPKPLPRI